MSDNKELFKSYKANSDVEIRNILVEQYLPVVDIVISRYLGKGVDRDDLYQTGAMALMHAVERFDPDLGYDFKSYATPTIIGEIKRYFRDKGWALQVPRRMKELSLQIDKVQEEFYSKEGRQPRISDIAASLRATDEEILEAMEGMHHYSAFSLEQVMEAHGAEGGGTTASVDDFTGIQEEGYYDVEGELFLHAVMDKLSKSEQVILRDRMLGSRTQGDIAGELGVSQMTVSRLEKGIREKFREEYYR